MLEISRILCPIDFSEFSVLAYDYAQSLAWHYGASLLLEHVTESLTPMYPYYAFPNAYVEISQELRAHAEQQLQEFARTHTRLGVQPECCVKDGIVADAILDMAEAQAVSLIVMGTHGLRGIERVMLGSVTDKVLRKTHCPVLAVRKPLHDLATQAGVPDIIRPQRVLCCTDFSDQSEQALEYAVSLTTEYGGELTLLHVLENVAGSADVENEIAKAMQNLVKQISPETRRDCKTKTLVRIGKPYQQILELALESRTDLIVMGVRGRNALDLAVFGSTTYRVVQLGPCPVLVVHTQEHKPLSPPDQTTSKESTRSLE
ncbi:MAG TPA: universal stress protein [Terriglobia bacterium]|nr:universal stress protein [Terriglobia bacterium]